MPVVVGLYYLHDVGFLRKGYIKIVVGLYYLLSILIVRLRSFLVHRVKLPDLPIRQAHIAVAVVSFAVVHLTPKCQPFYSYTNF